MTNWPPDPNKVPDNNPSPNNSNNKSSQPPRPLAVSAGGREWHLLEKTLLASIEEQRRARRWRVISKILSLLTLLLIIFMISRSCSSTDPINAVDVAKPHLAVVDIQGVIGPEDTANAYDVSTALTDAFEAKGSKAVVLNINSPGGSPVQSDEIWQTMVSLREEHPEKKLYAVIGDMGASGAYYIASAADEIYVNPSSLVGSIGVIMPGYNIEGLMDKAGIKDTTLTAGEYKDILSMSRELTDYERQHVKSVLDNTHKHFINAVKKGRGNKLKEPEKNNLFSGLFWTGEQAINLGLADKKGSLMTLEKELELDNVIDYSPVDPMELFLNNFAMQLGSGIGSTVELKLIPEEQNSAEMK